MAGIALEDSQSGAICVSRKRTWYALGLLFLCHVYFLQVYPHFVFTNEKTRFLLISAISDYGTASIDQPLREFGGSQDKAYINGHFYCDKAIGTSVLGLPVYSLLKWLRQPLHIPWDARVLLVFFRIICVTIPALLFLIPLRKFWADFCPDRVLASSFLFLFLFGTIVFTTSLQFISHHLVGIFLFLSFYFAYGCKGENPRRWKLILSGVFSGAALITEYPAIVPVSAIFVYVFFVVSKRRRIGYFILGVLPFISASLFYNYLIFGTPFDLTYRHEFDPEHAVLHSQGFVGLGLPRPAAIYGLLFSSSRGMFFFSPFLLFAFPGFYYFFKDRTWRREAALFLIIILSYTYFHSSISMWNGGWALGPRYLTAVIPFLATGALFFFSRSRVGAGRMARAALVFTGLISVAFVTVGTITFPFPDHGMTYPTFHLFFPLFARGVFPLNLGDFVGLRGVGRGLFFYLLLLLSYLILVLPQGALQFPPRQVVRNWTLAAGAAVLFIAASILLVPQPDAFNCYARGSVLFYFGRDQAAVAELAHALQRNPDKNTRRLIDIRLRQLVAVGAIRSGPAGAGTPP
jgi:hypothetical protein